MSAGDDRRQHGIQDGIIEPVRGIFPNERTINVTEEMIDPDQRQVVGDSKTFGIGHPDQESGHESGSVCHGYGGKIGGCDPCILQRLIHHRSDRSQMFAGSQFRDHATIG